MIHGSGKQRDSNAQRSSNKRIIVACQQPSLQNPTPSVYQSNAMTPGRILLLLALTVQLAASQSPIHNVIVLMMENRSFDHFLGHLRVSAPLRSHTCPFAPTLAPSLSNPLISFAQASFNPKIDGLDPHTMCGSFTFPCCVFVTIFACCCASVFM